MLNYDREVPDSHDEYIPELEAPEPPFVAEPEWMTEERLAAFEGEGGSAPPGIIVAWVTALRAAERSSVWGGESGPKNLRSWVSSPAVDNCARLWITGAGLLSLCKHQGRR